MTNLRVVDLRGNALRALPDDIGCLVRLETLDVGENALETLPKSLGNCRRLRPNSTASANATLDGVSRRARELYRFGERGRVEESFDVRRASCVVGVFD